MAMTMNGEYQLAVPRRVARATRCERFAEKLSHHANSTTLPHAWRPGGVSANCHVSALLCMAGNQKTSSGMICARRSVPPCSDLII